MSRAELVTRFAASFFRGKGVGKFTCSTSISPGANRSRRLRASSNYHRRVLGAHAPDALDGEGNAGAIVVDADEHVIRSAHATRETQSPFPQPRSTWSLASGRLSRCRHAPRKAAGSATR